MREDRNPFKLNRSEQIESDSAFLRLFCPLALDMLAPEHFSHRPLIFRSAPGAGKSTLLHLFTPRCLKTLHRLRDTEPFRDTYLRLLALQVINDHGPALLGVKLSESMSKYSHIEHLDTSNAHKNRLFFGLLNARITLASLRAACEFVELRFPEELDSIVVQDASEVLPLGLSNACSGVELFNAARDLEERVSELVDSPEPIRNGAFGQDTISSLLLLRPSSFRVKGKDLDLKGMLMLDDVHLLTGRQREVLFHDLFNWPRAVGVILGERIDALPPEEVLNANYVPDRHFNVIYLENHWRQNRRQFEKVLINIADRRAKESTIDVGSISDCLQENSDSIDIESYLTAAKEIISTRIRRRTQHSVKYAQWVKIRDEQNDVSFNSVVLWRSLEILIEREERRVQGSFEFSLGPEVLDHDDDSQVRAAAEAFICREFKLPYYYGMSRLASMASSNIQQFLWLCEDLFEEASSGVLLTKSGLLTPSDQERILRKAVSKRWVNDRRRLGHPTHRLLDSIGKFAADITYLPNAPYAPGVTGVAIPMRERDRLIAAVKEGKRNPLWQLADTISTVIKLNYIEPILDYRCKGDYWMVLNLNRMLCMYYNLPLQYGGWREQKINTLVDWMSQGYEVREVGASRE